jgi:hypothetical protein
VTGPWLESETEKPRRILRAIQVLLLVERVLGVSSVLRGCAGMVFEAAGTAARHPEINNRLMDRGLEFLFFMLAVFVFTGAGPIFSALRLQEGLSKRHPLALVRPAVTSAIVWTVIFVGVWWSWSRFTGGT